MIKVLIVEDSHVMQQLLIYSLAKDPDLQVVGLADNGEEAIEATEKLRPDVIAMDWHMPKIDGLEATRKIMGTYPTPIVIVSSSYTVNEVMYSFAIIEAGALAIVNKPPSVDHPDYFKVTRELIQTLKLMSEVKMVKRFFGTTKKPAAAKPAIDGIYNAESEIKAVVIGASTGGPLVLQKIIAGLPKNFPAPLLIVQHISKGFVEGLVEWLNKTTQFPLHVAVNGMQPLPGHAYIAPDGFHMGVESGPRIVLSNHELENGLKPSVSYLFRTAAQFLGAKAVGVLLTGMGRDGAEELKLMKEKGAITIAQDQESSVVHGMPGEAIKLNAVTHVLSPDAITQTLVSMFKK